MLEFYYDFLLKFDQFELIEMDKFWPSKNIQNHILLCKDKIGLEDLVISQIPFLGGDTLLQVMLSYFTCAVFDTLKVIHVLIP